eukprot:TRINITY_DN8232_c0_g1_i1.p1 TRINITY_DN8232_c0_g1~~TRINITY_DN8232_c0_g1_i1.p1  ORF type:complete len:472 (-),score=119.75 TRINITY_DN8232_c0_g1_i1:256-1671(-)
MLPVVLLVLPTLIAGQCQVDLDALTGKYPPLLVQNGDFVFPSSRTEDDKRILTFEEDAPLDLYCHGSEKGQASTFVELAGSDTGDSMVSLSCIGGVFKRLLFETTVSVEAASCNKKQEPLLVRREEVCSPVGADGREDGLSELTRVSIGWNIGGKFKEQIGLCVDERMFATIWTNHTLHGANIDFRDIDPGRPGFRIDTSGTKRFFPWATSTKMNQYYSKKSQLSQVKKILGTNNKMGDFQLIETSRSGTHYFAKGHLSPDAAFVYNVMQDATYYFMNVAPQFQSFNNGNWKALEYNTRDLGTKLDRDLQVMTGTHGLLTYPDSNNNLTPIYLYNNTYVPAPKYYWKVVQDPMTNTAVAFIGSNDPHVTSAPLELCPNRCAEMPWVDWNLSDLDSGYMYCCSVEDAVKAIPAIPAMQSAGLLTLQGPGPAPGPSPSSGTCTAGPCTCTCAKNQQGVYTCTCTCNDQTASTA